MRTPAINKRTLLTLAAVVVYAACILVATLATRKSAAEENFNLQLFWSYLSWFQGDGELGREIILNIGLFAPFGFLLASCIESFQAASPGQTQASPWRRRLAAATLAGLALSLCVEISQFAFHLGLAELDDIVSNTLGTAIGAGAETLLSKVLPRRKAGRAIWVAITVVCVVAGLIGCSYLQLQRNYNNGHFYALSTETITEEDGDLVFSGYAFSFDELLSGSPTLLLKADDPTYIPVHMAAGIERPEVSDYYFGDQSREACGFVARVSTDKLDSEKDYELVAMWPGGILPRSTGQHFVVSSGARIANGLGESEGTDTSPSGNAAADGVAERWVMRTKAQLDPGGLDLSGTKYEDLTEHGALLDRNERYGVCLIQRGNTLYLIEEIDKAPDASSASVLLEIETSRPDLLPSEPSTETAESGFPVINGLTGETVSTWEVADGKATDTTSNSSKAYGAADTKNVKVHVPYAQTEEVTAGAESTKYRIHCWSFSSDLRIERLSVHVRDPETEKDYWYTRIGMVHSFL